MNLNPFSDSSLVQGYEDWHTNQGHRTDCIEKAFLEWLIGHFQASHVILEVGCGTGHFTRWFEIFELWAVGLDISAAMLQGARRHGIHAAVQDDAMHLPFADGALDLVALFATIEFLRDPMMILREASRVARRGLILGAINCKSWSGRAYRRQSASPWRSSRFFTPHELAHMLKAINHSACKTFWRTILWTFFPWALALPWGGFIGIGLSLESNDHSLSATILDRLILRLRRLWKSSPGPTF